MKRRSFFGMAALLPLFGKTKAEASLVAKVTGDVELVAGENATLAPAEIPHPCDKEVVLVFGDGYWFEQVKGIEPRRIEEPLIYADYIESWKQKGASVRVALPGWCYGALTTARYYYYVVTASFLDYMRTTRPQLVTAAKLRCGELLPVYGLLNDPRHVVVLPSRPAGLPGSGLSPRWPDTAIFVLDAHPRDCGERERTRQSAYVEPQFEVGERVRDRDGVEWTITWRAAFRIGLTNDAGHIWHLDIDYARTWMKLSRAEKQPWPGPVYVCAESGDDSNPGTVAQPFKTVARALEHIGDRGKVCFKRGSAHREVPRCPG